MIIDDIVAKIDEGGSNSYFAFETFIINLLKHHLALQKKPLLITEWQDHLGDALAPEGIDGFEGPVVFEIKLNLESSRKKFIDAQISRFIDYNKINYSEARPKNLIFISAKPLSKEFRSIMPAGFQVSADYYVGITYWGPEDINKIVSQHRAKTTEIVNNLFSLRIEATVTKKASSWNAERAGILAKLKESYNRGQFTLFLGAGVSSSAGMPSWDNLLNSLFVAYLTREFDKDKAIDGSDISELVSRLNKVSESSALMGARYLRKGLAGNSAETHSFVDAITKSLYELRSKDLSTDSRLLKAIAATCMPRRTGARVRSVVNYNFDDLLEKQLAKTGIAHRSVYTETEIYDPDELPVYHVHGFLPEDRSKYSALENSTLVFSEEGYHHIYTNAYHWSNLVQLNCLRENSCLMIGLSMTDPNLRRLMDISARSLEQKKHFAFMKRLSIDDFCYDITESGKKAAIRNIDGAEKFLDTHHALNESLMRELGVTILWYEGYDEIPEILEELIK
ncbi:SIR2 family protein [Pseudomonas sp. 21LCFQ02]|uniref:SIR2 family protein n=1 Tax=Pseudomonas sp. 21LCFQ02 TaxID=2957505 RepID=UPI00209A8189|nr:SIR2 family protein [Pseudomonas sp. 21LCFQ02]MCO8167838.1 SIR2 family protein [Pseudomonas sp. 21LCFQ02]